MGDFLYHVYKIKEFFVIKQQDRVHNYTTRLQLDLFIIKYTRLSQGTVNYNVCLVTQNKLGKYC